jgi:hypothetical protein
MLMRQEEFFSPVAAKALREFSGIPVEMHALSIRDFPSTSTVRVQLKA